MKLLMENWRRFIINEAKYDAESGALSYLVRNKLINLVKAGDLKQADYEIEIPKDVIDNPNFNPTKSLNNINKVILKVKDNPEPDDIVVTGGSIDSNNNLNISFSSNISGLTKDKLNKIQNISDKLVGLITHELVHTGQDISGTMSRYDLELKKNRKNLGQKIRSYARYFQSKIIQVFKKDNYAQQYDSLLKEKAEDLKYLRSIMPEDIDDKKFILYFLQPIEIEAYARGFYSEARSIAERKHAENRKQGIESSKDNLTNKYFDQAMTRQLKLLNRLTNSLIALVGDDIDAKAISIINKAKEEFVEKVYEYAMDNFSVLTR